MFDFYGGEVLLFDKPYEWSSFDVVNKVRIAIKRKYGKKLKVGHAGTLDPLATGLLILCTGKKTKTIVNFSDLDKEYEATVAFGETRPSYDMETLPDESFDVSHITSDLLDDTIKTFIGKQTQYPPIFSAKKVNGEKAYINARLGKEINMRAHEVEIKEIDILERRLPNEVSLRMLVSKGTYIRSFANDLGKRMDSGAYLKALRRTKIGDYDVKDALSIEQFLSLIEGDELLGDSV